MDREGCYTKMDCLGPGFAPSNPAGQFRAWLQRHDHMNGRPVNHRRKNRVRFAGRKMADGGAKCNRRYVVTWLNQVGSLNVHPPSSLIQGFSKVQRGRGRGKPA